MGYNTDYIGCVEVWPPLNHAEQQYLTAFRDSRRYDRVDGPYAVPGNPAAEHEGERPPADRYNRVASGQPSLWCDWLPTFDGACLGYDGREKFYGGTAWMIYLIDHFLRPGAMARTSTSPLFAEFTFDHVVDGVIAGSRRDERDLFLISVVGNEVSELLLWSPVRATAGRQRGGCG